MNLDQLTTDDFEKLKSHKSDFFNISKEGYNSINCGKNLYVEISKILAYIKNIQLIDLKAQAVSNLGVIVPIHHHFVNEKYTSHGLLPIKSYNKYYTEVQFTMMRNILSEINKILG